MTDTDIKLVNSALCYYKTCASILESTSKKRLPYDELKKILLLNINTIDEGLLKWILKYHFGRQLLFDDEGNTTEDEISIGAKQVYITSL